MITVKIQGGLGNQMFQYAAGRASALKTRSLLRLDASWYTKSKNRKFELSAFNIKAKVKKYGVVNRIIEKFLNTNKKYITEKTYLFTPKKLKSVGDSVFSGYWQSEKYFRDAEKQIRDEFTLREPLSTEASEWADKISEKESVSVHIRRGDYLWEKHKKIHGVLPTDYYQKAAKIVADKNQNAIFYCFSDDITWAKDNLKLPYPTEFVSNERIGAPEEMILMSRCKHNIIANSSFSWWGAWLNPNPDKIVIAPKDWFADPKNNSADDIIPQTWLRI